MAASSFLDISTAESYALPDTVSVPLPLALYLSAFEKMRRRSSVSCPMLSYLPFWRLSLHCSQAIGLLMKAW